jgi:hypothetical protein
LFVEDCLEPGSVVRTHGWLAYLPLEGKSYRHEITFQKGKRTTALELMARAYVVVAPLTVSTNSHSASTAASSYLREWRGKIGTLGGADIWSGPTAHHKCVSRFGRPTNNIPISELPPNKFLLISLCFLSGQAILIERALVYDFLKEWRGWQARQGMTRLGMTRLGCGY